MLLKLIHKNLHWCQPVAEQGLLDSIWTWRFPVLYVASYMVMQRGYVETVFGPCLHFGTLDSATAWCMDIPLTTA